VILVDTGPLVALFDPKDSDHTRCRDILERLHEPLFTTVAVLTEAFHLLAPASRGAYALREFVMAGGVTVWHSDAEALVRSFELMDRYADHPMDLADASLVVCAERQRARRVWTLDRRDFESYRVRRGHRQLAFQVVRS